MKKSLPLIILFVLLILVLVGCGNQSTAGNETLSDIAFFAYYSEPILDWDPSVMFSNGVIVLNNVYETLLRYNSEDKSFEYILAEDYFASEDNLTWTFLLREGVKFHDGTEMTAEDVKYSIDRTKGLQKGASYIWDAVNEITVVDDYTVEFHLSYPAPINLIVSSPYAAFIMSKDIVEANGEDWFRNENEAGTGPYMLESTVMGNEVVLAKFDDYWRGWEGEHFEKVLFKKTPEASSRRQLIESGNADVTTMLPIEDIEALKKSDNVKIISNPSFTTINAFLNTQKAPLDNILVRQALSYAFPYEDVVNYAMGSYAKQARGPIPSKLWGTNDSLFQFSTDLEKAKALLAEAGIKEGELKLLMTYMSGDEAVKKTAELFKAELSKIGINLEIRGMPWESQWEMAKAKKPEDRQDITTLYWWPDVSSPSSFLSMLYQSEEDIRFNLGYYSNNEVDNLIDSGIELSGSDLQKAEEEFIKAQEIIIKDCVSIFMVEKEDVYAISSSFNGFNYNPSYPGVVYFYDCYRSK